MPRSPASVRSVYVLLTDACSSRSGATSCGGAKNCGVACLGSVVTIGEAIAVIAHLLLREVYRKKYRCDAEPVMHMSLCPDNVILARLSGSFAPCSVSTLAERHDDEGVIYLRQRVVNVMQ